MKYIIKNQNSGEYLKYSNKIRAIWSNNPIEFNSPEKILNYLKNSYPTENNWYHPNPKLQIIPVKTKPDEIITNIKILEDIIEKFEEYQKLENTLIHEIRLINYNYLKTNARKLQRRNIKYLIYYPNYPHPKKINELLEQLKLIVENYIHYENTIYIKTTEDIIAAKLILQNNYKIFELSNIYKIIS